MTETKVSEQISNFAYNTKYTTYDYVFVYLALVLSKWVVTADVHY